MFAVIFICGLAFGAAITNVVLHAKLAGPNHQQSMANAQRMGLDRLKTGLGLTAGQEQTIMKVLDDYGKYYQNIEDEREDVADHGRQRILSVLNAQQRKRFLELLRDPSLLPNSPLH